MNDYIKETVKESDILNSTEPTVTLSTGETVVIYKCKLKQIGSVLRFIAYMLKAMGMKDINDKPEVDLSNPTKLMMLIADGADHIYPLVASLCSLSLEQLENLDIEDALDIMTAEWDLNKDFFLQKVMPMLGASQTTSPTSKGSKKKRNTRKKRVS